LIKAKAAIHTKTSDGYTAKKLAQKAKREKVSDRVEQRLRAERFDAVIGLLHGGKCILS